MLSLSLLERNYSIVSLQIAAHPVHAISFAAGEELFDSIIANHSSPSSCYLFRCWRGTIRQYHCKSQLTQFMLSLSLLERNYSIVSLQIAPHPVHAISFAAELFDSIIANRSSPSSCYLFRCWRGTIRQYHCKSQLTQFMLSLSLLERNYSIVSLQIAAHPVHAISFAAGEELFDSIIVNRSSPSSCYLFRCWRGTIRQYHCKSQLTQFMLSLSLLERNYSTVSLKITAHPVYAISFAAGEELFDSIIGNRSSPSSCYLFRCWRGTI